MTIQLIQTLLLLVLLVMIIYLNKISWIASKLNVSRQIVYIWKEKQQIPEDKKLAICYVTGQTYEQLF